MASTSLLQEIQTAATDPALSLSDMLRKCQILAFRLRHEPFKALASHELNGCPAGVGSGRRHNRKAQDRRCGGR